MTTDSIADTYVRRLPHSLAIPAVLVALGAAGAWLTRRIAGDLPPGQVRDAVSSYESIRTLGEALRAQTHEHGNRMHTTVALLELCRTEEETTAMSHVLLVDDDALTLELHRTYLKRLGGFEVIGECTGARAAVGALLDVGRTFDLVLLDVRCPTTRGSTCSARSAPGACSSTWSPSPACATRRPCARWPLSVCTSTW